jgi:hypothetical protein
MSNRLYRAERCRDLAEECHAIAALCGLTITGLAVDQLVGCISPGARLALARPFSQFTPPNSEPPIC